MQVARLEGELEAAAAEVSSEQARSAAASSDLERLQADLEAVLREKEQLVKECSARSGECDARQRQVVDLEGSLREAVSKLQQSQHVVANKEAALGRANEELDVVRGERTAAITKLLATTAFIERLEGSCQMLQSDKDEALAELADATSHLDEMVGSC